MYSIYCDGECIYDDLLNADELQLLDAKLELEVNSAGTFTCTIPPNTEGFTKVKRLASHLIIYRNNSPLWEGRVIQENSDFWGDRKITCEGALSFLNDTVQEPAAYFNMSIKDFLLALLTVHNKKIKKYDTSKMFYLGNVTVEGNVGYDKDAEDYETFADQFKPKQEKTTVWYFETTNYETTLDCIFNKLVAVYGGYIVVRLHSNGRRYIDYLKDYKTKNTQEINFGDNLLSFVKNWDLSNLRTVIIPLGAQKEEDKSTSYIENMDTYTKYLQKAQGRKLTISKGAGFDYIDVLEYSKKAKFPKEGTASAIYLDATTGIMYGWNGTEYLPITAVTGSVMLPAEGASNTVYYAQFEGQLFFWNGVSYTALYDKSNAFPKPGNNQWFYVSFSDYSSTELNKNYYKFLPYQSSDSSEEEAFGNNSAKQYYAVSEIYDTKSAFPAIPSGSDPLVIVYFVDKSTKNVWQWNGNDYVFVYRIGEQTSSNVKHYNTKSAFPSPGDPLLIYVDDATHKQYIWDASTSKYVYYQEDDTFYSEKLDSVAELSTIPVGDIETTLPVVSDDEFPAFQQYVTLSGSGKADYVKSDKAIAKYGWIEEVVNFDGVNKADVLLKKAKDYLKDNQFEHMKITVTAYDLSILNPSIPSLNLLDAVRCFSEPHGLDAYFPVQKISLSLTNPENTVYTLDKETSNVTVTSRSSTAPGSGSTDIGTEATVESLTPNRKTTKKSISTDTAVVTSAKSISTGTSSINKMSTLQDVDVPPEKGFGIFTYKSAQLYGEGEINYYTDPEVIDTYVAAYRLFNAYDRYGTMFATDTFYESRSKGIQKFLTDYEVPMENLVIFESSSGHPVCIYHFTGPVKCIASRRQMFMFADTNVKYDRYIINIVDNDGNYTVKTAGYAPKLNSDMKYIEPFNVYGCVFGCTYMYAGDSFRINGGWTTLVPDLGWDTTKPEYLSWDYGYDWLGLLYSDFPVYSPLEDSSDSSYVTYANDWKTTAQGYNYFLNSALQSHQWTDFSKHVVWYTANGYEEHTEGEDDGNVIDIHNRGDFIGCTAEANGQHGYVPEPKAGDQDKFLKADGTWSELPDPGTDVSITPSLVSGTKIADYEIDGTQGSLYAPNPGSTVIANPSGQASTDLTKVSIDGTVYSLPEGGGGSDTPDIPIGITVYEYGQFSGSAAYDTGIQIDGDHKIEIVFSTDSYVSGMPIFGTTDDSETYRYSYPHTIEWDNKFYYGRGSGSGTITYTAGKHDFIFNDNGENILDGTVESTYTPVSSTYNYRLGRRESSSSYIFNGKLYEFKISSNTTGELLHHLVAAKRLGTVGFYDMVTQGFTAFSGMTPGGESHSSDNYVAEVLWEGDWNGSNPLTVPGLSDWLLVAYSNYADDTYLFIGNPDRGGSNYGVYGSSSISDIAYRFSFNKSTNTLSVNQNDRGLYFTNGTTYDGSSNCNVKRIYGLIKKPDSSSVIDYSTSEQRTGQKWIDGKDIYQITLTGTGSGQGSLNIDISSLNASMVMIDFGSSYVKRTDTNEYVPPTYVNKDSLGYSFGAVFNASFTQLKLYTGYISFGEYAITLKYTKST